MQVNLYAQFRLHAGVKSFTISLPPDANMHQAVLHIVNTYPVLRKDWLDENDCLRDHVRIFVDGSEVSALPQGLDSPLEMESVLDFFPPLSGGGGIHHKVTR